MKDAIGGDRTRDDHADVANQLYSSYAAVQNIRALAAIVGAEELTDSDQRHLKFGDAFEQHFVGQARDERRTITDALDVAWRLLSMLPEDALHRVSPEEIEAYYQAQADFDGDEGV